MTISRLAQWCGDAGVEAGRAFLLCFPVAALLCVGGCTKSRVELLRDRSAMVEQKLEQERNRVLTGGELANSGRGGQSAAISHLQTLRGALSVVNVSITSVPLFLSEPEQREVGYSVLDEALGTIGWNIPIYVSSSGTAVRDYPSLFSPQQGLDFSGIRQGLRPTGIAR